jgi:hypothetical protein
MPPPLFSVSSARLLAMLNYANDGGRDRVQYELRCGDFWGLVGLKLRVAVFELSAQNLVELPC